MTETIARTVFIMAAGFLLGSVLPAELLARRREVDIRSVGDGNPGAVNAFKGLGVTAGVIALAYDMSVGVATIQLAWLLHAPASVAYLGGLMTIIGHRFPAFQGYRDGGQGMAACAGMLLYGIVVAVGSGWLSLPTILLVVAFGVAAFLITRSDKWIAMVILPTLVAALAAGRPQWEFLAFMTLLSARIWLVQLAVVRESHPLQHLWSAVTRFRH